MVARTVDLGNPRSIACDAAEESEMSQQPMTVPGAHGGEINLLRRKGNVDDILESLHRILEHQANEPPVAPVQQTSAPVSLAIEVSSALARKSKNDVAKARRKNRGQDVRGSKVKKALISAESLYDVAAVLGADLEPTRKLLMSARRAARKGEFGRASYGIQKATSALKDAISSEYELRLNAVNDSIGRTARTGGNVSAAKRILSSSRRSMKKGEFRDAVTGIIGSEKALRDSQTELVLRILYDSKNSFMIANKAGLDIGPAVDLVNDSRRKLRDGDIEGAIVQAKKGVDAIGVVLGNHDKARSTLLMCNRAIGAAESVGAAVEAAREHLEVVTKQFQSGKYDLCVTGARNIVADMKQAAHDRAAEAVGLAERAAKLAEDAGIAIADSEDYIAMAKDALGKDEFAKCIELSSLSMYRSNSTLATELGKKVRNIDKFAKGITGELSSMTEVEKAIAASKERSLETVRKYAEMTEEIVGQAYDSAVSYTRVTQDVVKQACHDFLGPEDGVPSTGSSEVELTSDEPKMSPAAISVKNDSQRLRIVDLYLRGKITDVELDRLLLMLDSGPQRAELV